MLSHTVCVSINYLVLIFLSCLSSEEPEGDYTAGSISDRKLHPRPSSLLHSQSINPQPRRDSSNTNILGPPAHSPCSQNESAKNKWLHGVLGFILLSGPAFHTLIRMYAPTIFNHYAVLRDCAQMVHRCATRFWTRVIERCEPSASNAVCLVTCPKI